MSKGTASDWTIVRAYLLDAWRGFVVVAAFVLWASIAVAIGTGNREYIGPLIVPVLVTAWIAWDFMKFRRSSRTPKG